MPKKVLSVIGARPQFVKAAPVSRALASHPLLSEVMLHTGQHFDTNMSDVFFDELDIPKPAYHLNLGGGGHGAMTGRMLEHIESIILEEKPDWVLVYGDTNSTLAGALAAAKLHVPIAHVEAGLRSFNRCMPEEVNRVLTDHISTLLFCPTRAAVANLGQEGIVAGVHHVGDVMHDATIDAAHRAAVQSQILERLGMTEGSFALATIHRAENTDDPVMLDKVLTFLKNETQRHAIVLPLHPRTRQAVARFGFNLEGLTVIEPVGYLDMARLLSACIEVLTDSGGVQKEAYFHRKPCTTLRSETEWVETVEAGWNRLWEQGDWHQPRRDIPDYGDGQAAEIIAAIIAQAS